jgi:predicted dehydrogenase/threonine dehydrogenase-like Zn-dependent dehydrogenase
MKQVVAKSGGVEVVEVPAPTNSEDEVLVANSYSVVSTGTESVTIERTEPRSYLDMVRDPKLMGKAYRRLRGSGVRSTLEAVKESRAPENVLGYSSAGVVLAVGRNITDINPGDRVACAGAGVANHAEVVSVPRNLLAKVPPSVGLDAASFATLGAIAMHGIRRARGQLGETIAVVGTGLIGLIGLQVARAAGMNVIAIDKDPGRVQLAKSMGADLAMAVESPEQFKEFYAATDGRGADAVVVYASGSGSEAVRLASRLTRDRGRVVVVGMVCLDLERGVLYEKELDVSMSRSYGPGRYDPTYEERGVDYPFSYVRWTENRNMQAFLKLLETGRVNVSKLVSEVRPLEEAQQAYRNLLTSVPRPISILFKYAPEMHVAAGPMPALSRLQPLSPRSAGGPVKVGLVGGGKFAKDFIIPNLKRNPAFRLVSLVSASPVNAKQTGERYGFEKCGTDFADILRDKDVDLVVVATPHNLHSRMVVESLKAGKAVFTEKPLCLTEGELEEIAKTVSETRLPVYVGFNRRYSPMILKTRDLLRQTQGPYLINYRVNGGHIPTSSWLQDPKVGGGRIIGECGHFFDLFGFLLGSKVRSIKVSSVPSGAGGTVSHDNFVASMDWEDGSVTSLTYTSLGSSLMPKERIEIFGGSRSIVVDDFKSAEFLGYSSGPIKLDRQDKGHAGEFDQLAKALSGGESAMISFEDAYRATKISIAVDAMVRAVGPRPSESQLAGTP